MTDLTTTTRNEHPSVPDDPAALRADIEDARERLGETVDELRYRLDVKARTQESLYRLRSRISRAGQDSAVAAGRHKSLMTVVGVVALVAVCGGSVLAWRRRAR